MTELETAAQAWKHLAEDAEMLRHPTMFVIHYHHDDFLGSINGTRVSNEANLVMILGSPFAVTDLVTDTFVFLDRPGRLLVSHLHFDGKGVHIKDYHLPYGFDDDGTVRFSVAHEAFVPELIRRACDHLSAHRLRPGPKHGFVEAFYTASKWGELHEAH